MKKVYSSSLGALGKKHLKDAVFKDSGVRLSDKQVLDWLAGQDAYSLHKTAPVKYKWNRIIVYDVVSICYPG